MFKKRILTAIISISMLCSAMPAFAYDQASYHTKADELKALIAECQELGINTQYEEIDANIIEVYADRIAEFQANGLSSTITNRQLSELDSLYTNAKANLNAYISGTKEAPNTAYTYGTGDKIRISGASLRNKKGDPYFSAGVGHFGLSDYIEELKGYRFENVQTVVALGDIVTKDRNVDSWDAGVQGGADVTFEMVTNNGASNNTSLHIVNKTEKADNVYGTIYQRVPVKPNTEYEISFSVIGTNDAHGLAVNWDDWVHGEFFGYAGNGWTAWTKVTKTFTTGDEEYFRGIRFRFEDKCDIYLDDIVVKEVGTTKNRILNGGFDGDGTEDFDIFYNDQTNLLSTIKTLDEAEKNNVRVEVLLQLQQGMPEVILKKYPEIGESGGRYNIDHAVAQKVEKAYIEGVLTAIADYDSLGSIIVANEPAYNSADYDYGSKFASYLEKKYGTIGALNSAYGGKTYADFAAVKIPTAFESSARFYDWKNFNEEIFSNWYAKTVQIIKNCIPGIPVSIKAQPDMAVNDSSTKRNEQLIRGLDIERLAQLSDYNGNDSYSHNNSNETDSVRSAMMWYDYLGSTSGKPIYDSEKHITEDANMSNYNDDLNKFIKQVVWESMIHGLDMYSIWTWELDVKDTSSSRYGHLALRPKALSEIAKSGLDANRLGDLVTAISNADPTVAILRSDASRIYNAKYMSAMSVAHMAANEAGHKVGFVTNKNIESELSKYDILIIPYTTNVEANVINAIAKFNGKIVMLDSDSLKKNEYNVSYSGDMSTKVTQIKEKATVTEVSGYSTYKITSPTVSSLKSSLVDSTAIKVSNDGTLYDDLEWHWAPYKNGYVVSVANYNGSSTRTVNITLNGAGFTNVTSLLDNQDVTSISMPALTSGLYYVRNVDDEALEEEVVVEYNDIIRLDATRSGTTNILRWDAETAGTYNIYNVEPDGTLELIESTSDTYFEDTSSGAKTYAVKCVIKDGESRGKKITCGYDVNSAITVEVVKNPINNIVINYTNDTDHSVAATVTATSYNSDGTFGSAVVMEMLVPAGKTVNYKKTFIGTGNVVIIKK